MAKDIEFKAYKELARIRGLLISRIISQAQRTKEYKLDSQKDLSDFVISLSSPSKWQHHGYVDKNDLGDLELLEYLLNDDATMRSDNYKR